MEKSEINSSRESVETIKEFLLDEQKIVTYISIAKELCIHVNEAKKLLSQVSQDIRNQYPDTHLNVNFIISGITDEHSARTLICSESDLENYKKSFIRVLYHHVYSISPGKGGVDNAALVSLTKFEDFSLCPGLVKNNICSKRTSEDTELLKRKCQSNMTETKAISVKKEKSVSKITNGVEDSHKEVKTEPVSPLKTAVNGSTNKVGNKGTKGIAGFFTKSNSAPTTAKSSKSDDKQTKSETKSMSSFLTKSNSTPITKPTKNIEVNEELMDVDIVDDIISKNNEKPKINEPSCKKPENKSQIKEEEMVFDIDDSTPKNKGKPTNKESKKPKNKSLSEIKKTGKVDKKRKRVLQVSDSESEEDPFADEKARDESDDEIPPTPAANTVKITSGILNPKKKRKIVDKTYTDEDGYILTRKEEVYESCSDDEPQPKESVISVEKENFEKANKVKQDVSPKDKKANKVSKKKISPPQKGKQATLTNFFKKI